MRSIARNLCPHSNPVRFPLVHDVVSSKTWTSLGAWAVPMMSSTRILLAAGWPGVGDEDRESLFTEAKTVSNVNGLYFPVVWWREGVKCVDDALWPPSLHVLKVALLKSASAKFTNRRHWVIGPRLVQYISDVGKLFRVALNWSSSNFLFAERM